MSDPTADNGLPTLSEVVELWFDAVQVRVDLAPSTTTTYGRASDHLVTWGSGRPLGVLTSPSTCSGGDGRTWHPGPSPWSS